MVITLPVAFHSGLSPNSWGLIAISMAFILVVKL